MRIDHQIGQGRARRRGGQPSECVHEADLLHRYALSSARLQHDHSDQVINNCKNVQLLEAPRLGLAVKHAHPERRLQVGEIGLHFPSLKVQGGQVFRGRVVGIEQRRDQRDRAHAEADDVPAVVEG